MTPDVYDCPTDVQPGDEIDVMQGNMGPFRLRVLDRWVDEDTPFIRASASDGESYDIPLGFSWTWRRVQTPRSAYGFGARCSDKSCREWCPDAEAVPGFTCFRCRSRYS